MAFPWLNNIRLLFLLYPFLGGQGFTYLKEYGRWGAWRPLPVVEKSLKMRIKEIMGWFCGTVYLRDKRLFQDILFKR